MIPEIPSSDAKSCPLLDRLAAPLPPGGGSAAAHTAAAGAALVSMVAYMALEKASPLQFSRLQKIIKKTESLRSKLSAAVDQDAEVYNAFLEMRRNPGKSSGTPDSQFFDLQCKTIKVPLKVAERALKVYTLALQVSALGRKSNVTDAISAAVLANASINICTMNARANCRHLKDPDTVHQYMKRIEEIETDVTNLHTALGDTLAERKIHIPL
jgi:formiminotetrahydrofolate cyclodeaminase